jgi:hypothetical protein
MSELEAYFNQYRKNIIGIDAGDLSMKPGWIRLSLHPTMTNDELLFITDAIKKTIENIGEWQKDYDYDRHTNEFNHRTFQKKNKDNVSKWYSLEL